VEIDRPRFRFLTEIAKTVLPVLLTVALFAYGAFFFFLPTLEKKVMEGKRETIRELTETVWRLLDSYEVQVQTGELTLEQAQERAVRRIRDFRYGPEGKDYFWINDMHPHMVMHPFRPDLEGQDISGFTDPHGKRLFVAFVDAVKKDGSGYVDYMWQWKDDPERIVPKLSYVKEFAPWGWVVGTGIYLEDTKEMISKITRSLKLSFIGILSIISLLSLYIIWNSIRVEMSRFQTQQNLIKANRFISNIIDSMPSVLVGVDPDGKVTQWNEQAARSTGVAGKEALGQPLDKVFPRMTAEMERVMEAMRTRQASSAARKTHQEDKETRYEDVTVFPLVANGVTGAVIRVDDVTDRVRVEEMIVRASKLESIGLLAGGIAHDFNNILTAILGNASLAKLVVNKDSNKVIELLSESEKACLRAKDLTQQLLTFAKGGEPVKRVTAIKELLTSTVDFSLRGSNVRSEIDIPESLWPVEIDAGQIRQVIQNLVINACQAMPGGGMVKITAANVELNFGETPFLNEGKYLVIRVEDHGCGIRPEHLEKLFDPYFTTKQKGAGLGLTTCYSIVKRHGGHIAVESEPGAGSTFSVYLPAATGTSEEVIKENKDTRISSAHILVMDDDPGVRGVVARMLDQIGHEVEVASDGAEAITLYKEALRSGRAFDVVILDLTIPGGIGGKEVIKALLEIDPEVKAIVSSGYSNDPVVANYKQYGFCGMISKPYMMDELNEVLYQVLKK
jgi:two-component system, cell cycle sensor histidine kinase and response regulator CckA